MITVAPGLELCERLAVLWEQGVREAREMAASLRALAPSWRDVSVSQDAVDDARTEEMGVALALRCTIPRAARRIHDSHRAVDLLPRTFALLEEGTFPVSWFQQVLRRTGDFTDPEHEQLDVTVSTWDCTISADRFDRELARVVAVIIGRRALPTDHGPRTRRRTELLPAGGDGTGCVQLIGPLPEILAFTQDLDAQARAVQDAQKHALAAGTAVPCDPEGTVATTGKHLSLTHIRYWLMLTAPDLVSTGASRVTRPRFRVNVTVPFLTLMGLSDEPGLVNGTEPVPAVVAREIAAGEDLWHRVLTDPTTGTFLPLPADTYRPTAAMREHLRLRGPVCAAPGCTRSIQTASECDHIQEYDHTHPETGGLTEVENLHHLCWRHHDLKTRGLLDPIRHPGGITRWTDRAQFTADTSDERDLATPDVVTELTDTYRAYLNRHPAPDEPPPAAGSPPPGAGSPPGTTGARADTEPPPETGPAPGPEPPPPF